METETMMKELASQAEEIRKKLKKKKRRKKKNRDFVNTLFGKETLRGTAILCLIITALLCMMCHFLLEGQCKYQMAIVFGLMSFMLIGLLFILWRHYRHRGMGD